jgi:tRNA pseudouridine38-40 synthase
MRLAALIQYVGTDYYGFQRQDNLPTVQGAVEQALTCVAGCPIKIFGAGRTDRGVHALGQVVHFDSSVDRDEKAWCQGGNRYLPASINIGWVKYVSDDFHAQISAIERTYCYRIYQGTARFCFENGRSWYYPYPLDATLMQLSGDLLLGENDFSSYRAVGCQSYSPYRHVSRIHVEKSADLITIEITANAYLYHMVRNIVGSLVEVGTGKKTLRWFKALLTLKNRNKAGVTAPADGLYLRYIAYPERFNLPSMSDMNMIKVSGG